MMPEPDAVPVRSASAAWQVVDSELVILRTDARELVGVNDAARRVWDLVDGTRTVEQVAAELAASYGEPSDRALDDVRSFVAELVELNLLALVSTEKRDGS